MCVNDNEERIVFECYFIPCFLPPRRQRKHRPDRQPLLFSLDTRSAFSTFHLLFSRFLARCRSEVPHMLKLRFPQKRSKVVADRARTNDSLPYTYLPSPSHKCDLLRGVSTSGLFSLQYLRLYPTQVSKASMWLARIVPFVSKLTIPMESEGGNLASCADVFFEA